MHQRMAATLEEVVEEIRGIQRAAREGGSTERVRWPMIVLITPKGWTGPKEVDGKVTEGSHRSHQVPLSGLASHPEHLAHLERWLRSYRPEELFDEHGAPVRELAELAPRGERRMGANPHANGGLLLKDLELPDYRDYAVEVLQPARESAEATGALGSYLRDVMRANMDRFRLFRPRRDPIEPAERRLRGQRPDVGRRDP
jgi:xylulose-5-phosphate/fructose-6-phosphate phosphoketolase